MENSIISTKKKNNQYSVTPEDTIHANNLYTYKGYIKGIIDGDTLWVTLDLGFDTWTTRKLRLRGINSPGIETEEGKKARDFFIKQCSPCPFIIVKTHWRDKCNRYLADIFYDKGDTDPKAVTEKGKYINQLLLDKHLAQKYTG